MLPARYAPVLFGLVFSGQMSLLVSAISTWRAAGLSAGFLHLWFGSWLTAWAVAFPVVLVVAPATRRIVNRFVQQP